MVNSVYSPIYHLAHALFFKHNPKNHYFAMLKGHTAYFDASGDRKIGQILVVGGAITSVEKWDEFNSHWQQILKNAGVDEFHMTDFVGCYKAFKDERWKKDNGFAENFLRKLVNAICKKVVYVPVMLIYLDDWRELNREYQLKESGYSPLALAGTCCIAMIHGWCEKQNVPFDTVHIIFEGGDLDRGDLIDLSRQELGIMLPPFGKKELSALQACDLIAWEAANAEKDLIKRGGTMPEVQLRPSIKAIVDRIEVDPLEFGRAGMLKVCADNEIPKR